MKKSKQLDSYIKTHGPKKGKALFHAEKHIGHWHMRMAKIRKWPKG